MRTSIGAKFSQLTRGFQLALITHSKLLLILDSFRDGKWINQYDSAFFIFNSDGKILSWQFTRGPSFVQVKKLLNLIHQRAVAQNITIAVVYIDNCCQWKRLLQEEFGNDLLVKLDLFHAIQRITSKMPKRHSFYGAYISDLRVVFRARGNLGLGGPKLLPEKMNY